MISRNVSLSQFKIILSHTDWEIRYRVFDPVMRINGRTSIAYAADYFVALKSADQNRAKFYIREYMPKGWRGWPIVVRAALRRRDAFRSAIAMGTLSENKYAINYYGHYFYTHSEKGNHYFVNRNSYLSISSPYLKLQIKTCIDKPIFGASM